MTIDHDFARALARQVRGPVFAPGDAGYAAEVAGFNTAVVHTPDLVIGAASTTDVSAAVRFARGHGLRVSVQATGHTYAPIAGGLLISTRRLDAVAIDPGEQMATIGGGVRWGAVVAAAALHGLFPVAGSSLDVGVTGYLLGGGLGPLARAFGVSSDFAQGFRVVTGTGEVVDAASDSHADLFWALRGGKHGLGVVTETRLRLIPLRALYAGSLLFAEEQIEPALRRWIAWTAEADPRVTTSIAIEQRPAVDAVPRSLRGRRTLTLRFAFPGSGAEGGRLATPLRAAAAIAGDDLRDIPVSAIDQLHDDPRAPGPSWIGSLLLSHVDEGLASAVLDLFGSGVENPFVAMEIRQLGAATQQDVPGGSAVGGRAAAFVVGYAGVNPDHFATVLPAAADRLHDALDPWRLPENSINFLGAPRSADHIASAWPAAIRARLAAVRHRYDPDGIFAHETERTAAAPPVSASPGS